jgi:iron complex transport system ATP-binding protein
MGLKTENLCAGYGVSSVVQAVNIQLLEGKITALIGPNGCGKSTLLKALVRVLAPQSGRVLWQDKDINDYSPLSIAQALSLLPQSQETPEGILVRDIVGYGRSPYTGFWGQLRSEDQQKVDQAMRMTGITEFAHKAVSELSGGQRQRVWLAMTLAQNTDYVFLDEPTTYLDLNHQVELMKLLHTLRQDGKTLVTVLHDINQACRYCDHLIVMATGRVVAQGTPDEVLTVQLLNEVFELEAEIYRDPIAGTPMCVVK